MGIPCIAIFELYIKSKIAVFVSSEFHMNESISYYDAYISVEAARYRQYFNNINAYSEQLHIKEAEIINQIGEYIQTYGLSNVRCISVIFDNEFNCNWTDIFKYMDSTEMGVGTKTEIYCLLKIQKKYNKSLQHVIAETHKGKLYGEWNDYGKLLNYSKQSDS